MANTIRDDHPHKADLDALPFGGIYRRLACVSENQDPPEHQRINMHEFVPGLKAVCHGAYGLSALTSRFDGDADFDADCQTLVDTYNGVVGTLDPSEQPAWMDYVLDSLYHVDTGMLSPSQFLSVASAPPL